jgi:hypothetical protein
MASSGGGLAYGKPTLSCQHERCCHAHRARRAEPLVARPFRSAWRSVTATCGATAPASTARCATINDTAASSSTTRMQRPSSGPACPPTLPYRPINAPSFAAVSLGPSPLEPDGEREAGQSSPPPLLGSLVDGAPFAVRSPSGRVTFQHRSSRRCIPPPYRPDAGADRPRDHHISDT